MDIITFPQSQVFDNYAVTVMIGGEPYTLGLFDTAGNKVVVICRWTMVIMMINLSPFHRILQVKKIMTDYVPLVIRRLTYFWCAFPLFRHHLLKTWRRRYVKLSRRTRKAELFFINFPYLPLITRKSIVPTVCTIFYYEWGFIRRKRVRSVRKALVTNILCTHYVAVDEISS